MEHITLFTKISPEEQELMRVCFCARETTYQNNETIMEYSSVMKKIGLMMEGQALLYCCDADGNEYIIDELKKDSVFGEPFLLSGDSQHYYVRAQKMARVMFIDYEHVIKRCEKACWQQTNRIYMLSRSTTQKKLLAYLNCIAAEKHKKDITISMSYTTLAQYLGVDRSAMMRELKSLEDQKILHREGRIIHLLTE